MPPGSNAIRLRERAAQRLGQQRPGRRAPRPPRGRRLRPLYARPSRSSRPRLGFVLAPLMALLVLTAAGVYLYDHGRRDLIAPGVHVGGVDIGGLRLSAARDRLRARLVAPLRHSISVTAAGHDFTLTPEQARVTAAVDALTAQALSDSRRGSVLTRVMHGIEGRRLSIDLAPRVTYSRPAIRRLVAVVARSVRRDPQNASVAPSAGGLSEVAGHDGLALDSRGLTRQIEQALVLPGGRRSIAAPTVVLHPKNTVSSLAGAYPAYIVIDRAAFRLRFYTHLKLAHSYTIAVGRQGLETPAGLYDIQWKEVNPSWHVPNSSWAGPLAGRTIPPGPQDPIKARWMAFNGGAGIHGTDQTSSLGTAASHGCIRMAIPDVIALYPQVPVGTPVYVA